jgi:hypothetical protein
MKKKLLLFIAILLSNHFAHADWDPEFILVDENKDLLTELEQPMFKQLKENILLHLSQSWCSSEKINLLMDLTLLAKPLVCVEIGAFTGSSVLPVASTLKYIGNGKIFAIDAWSNFEATRYLHPTDPNRAWWASVNMEDMYNCFLSEIKLWGTTSYCIPIPKSSEKAISQIGNIDFLHIDGDYSEEGSFQDMNLYFPKLKSGGYILLSNIWVIVNGKQPKYKSMKFLFDSCELIAEIERGHSALFRKL